MTRTANVRAYAKLNLGLRVLYRRPDGYHELRTVFQTISLADRLSIEFQPARTTQVTVEGTPEIADKLVKSSFDNTISLDKLNADYYDKIKKAVGAINSAKYMQLEIYLQTMWKAVIQSNIPLVGAVDKSKQN